MSEARKISVPKGFGVEAERFFQGGRDRAEDGAPIKRIGERLEGVNLAKHQLRAMAALAEHVCAARLTDGFCRSENRPECRCWQEADGLLKAMGSRGVFPVWFYEIDLPNPSPSTVTGGAL